MDASTFDKTILVPALDWFRSLVVEVPVKRDSHVLLLAIAGQETNYRTRLQQPIDFAHGWFQFELGGATKGVLSNSATSIIAKRLCANYNLVATPKAVWTTLGKPEGDNLAVGFARLLLWSDPKPLPAVGDEDAAYATYIKNWGPGKPDRARWRMVYPQAMKVISA